MNTRHVALLLALVLTGGIGGFALAAVFIASNPPHPSSLIWDEPQQTSTNNEQPDPIGNQQAAAALDAQQAKADTTNDQQESGRDAANWWMVWLTAVTTITLIVQGCVLFFQAYQNKRTVDSFKFRERAHLIVANAKIDPKWGDGKVAGFWMSHGFHNVGGTAALVYKYRTKIFVARELDDVEVSLSDATAQVSHEQVPIQAGETAAEDVSFSPIEITLDEFQEIQENKAPNRRRVFAVTSIWYKDVFGDRRTFIGAVKLKGKTTVPTRSGGFNRHYDGYRYPNGSVAEE